MSFDFASWLSQQQSRVETALNHWLPASDLLPARLHAAMRYSVLDGGKRVRPLLVYAAGAALDAVPSRLDGPACAVEIIHAYSLIHDDLPAMDDDELRRGKPTCHRKFDEATAILAGDALQALAFHILVQDSQMVPEPASRVKMIGILAQAAGSRGMAGGQAIDLAAVGQTLDIAQLENMHIHKTGALIRASVLLGGLSCDLHDESRLAHLDRYAKNIGLAFQIRDDILDIEGETAIIGKAQGADALRNKPTYPALLGLDGAKARAQELLEEASDVLAPFGEKASPLRAIASYIVQRNY